MAAISFSIACFSGGLLVEAAFLTDVGFNLCVFVHPVIEKATAF